MRRSDPPGVYAPPIGEPQNSQLFRFPGTIQLWAPQFLQVAICSTTPELKPPSPEPAPAPGP
jgi:hypothetical protein